MKDVKVSIVCITYNQVEYIGDALDSFIMQKTNFEYEVLVHDDASTDGTKEIIYEYEKRYPEIIKPIYQDENQYSKGTKIFKSFQFPRAKGKYISFCEGDDYWTDPNKLQKQYDFMEENSDYYLCTHAANKVSAKTKAIVGVKKPMIDKEYYGMKDAIQGYGRWVATASMFIRREVFYDYPKYALVAPCGDYVYAIMAAEKGKIAYLSDNMADYRIQAKNSLSQRWSKDSNKLFNYYKKYEKMLVELNEHTKGKYNDEIENEYTRIWFTYYSIIGDKKVLKEERFRLYFEKLPVKRNINLMKFMEVI